MEKKREEEKKKKNAEKGKKRDHISILQLFFLEERSTVFERALTKT